jgi:hypothetical protein
VLLWMLLDSYIYRLVDVYIYVLLLWLDFICIYLFFIRICTVGVVGD